MVQHSREVQVSLENPGSLDYPVKNKNTYSLATDPLICHFENNLGIQNTVTRKTIKN